MDFDGLSYDDVLLRPRKGILRHRKSADLRAELVPNLTLDMPIVSAPMSSVTEHKMAIAMKKNGGFGIIHRDMSIDSQVEQFLLVNSNVSIRNNYWMNAGCAIGIDEGYDRSEALLEAGCLIQCIDVAHAHHEAVEDFISNMTFRNQIKLIVGNIATSEAAEFMHELDVDAVKVGIGPGAACTTRQVTGFGVPQLSAIVEVRETLDQLGSNIKIIADGGIKNSGDMVKALAAGADTVMLGRLLAGADEAPFLGEYFGMASKRANGHKAPEGTEGKVDTTGPVKDSLHPLLWGLRSGVSYAGSTNLIELRESEWIRIGSGVNIENQARV